MSERSSHRLGLAVLVVLVIACSSSQNTGKADWSTQSSASGGGGISALVAAAKAEGQLNLIAVPREWANYGAILDGFTAKYGIRINSTDPNGYSPDEIDAVKQLGKTSGAPDVLDLNMKVALANTTLFTPYRVSHWDDIPAVQKESSGLWFQDYGGYMAIGYDSSKVPAITSIQDLLGAAFHNKVALSGDPTTADAALNGVMMASLANGGTLDDIGPGVDFFHQLKVKGNFLPVPATSATVKRGQTPVVFDWDYLSLARRTDVPTWQVFVPSNAILGYYDAQAVNKNAPHPAAARLWEEYLYSDDGQNLWLRGGVRPVRMEAMQMAGTIDAQAAAALPPVSGTPVFLAAAQAAAAGTYLSAHWAKAVS